MATIQKLYEVCKVSLSTNGPLSSEAVDSICAVLARPAKIIRDGEMSAPCGTMVIHPTDGGNIHAFKAITPCAILDILSPPYSSEDGRHCSYFRRCQKADPSGILSNRSKGSEIVWLEEHQPPNKFVIKRDLYTGPPLNL
uniref:cysteine dioxygenase n=1 Tax=Leersia perrieri TaxID=77586 RepID=A0A0D9XCF5_9ORYZ